MISNKTHKEKINLDNVIKTIVTVEVVPNKSIIPPINSADD